MRYGFIFLATALLIICFQLVAVFRMIDRKFCEVDFNRPLKVELPLFKKHQDQCRTCSGIIDNGYGMPCEKGFKLIYEDNRRSGL